MITERKEACATLPRAEVIARLNDALRKRGRGGVLTITLGVRTLPGFVPEKLLAALADYDAFDADNDPHGERDFGDLEHCGADLLWKVDYYDASLEFGSDDPADPEVTKRILTLMLASEY